ncbi:hypothetical protein JTE90_000394 [Oedothorax gibbosus]|uniref:EGF-like domain-containing protein n=1 Tax=Oedothorax gibbosus TaxID=931172 RepID=A0AAV6URG5_9ARAC|nr:hypothetical protein JTE90_000394 [Oedothorax gibbosus]
MKFQFLLDKYICFVLVTVSFLHFNITSAYPHLRARREPGGGRVSYWRRQAPISKAVLDTLSVLLNQTNDCGNCTDLAKKNANLEKELAKKEIPETKHLRPAYECDRWDNVSRTCWLDRNIGDTVTFVLNFAEGANPQVQWRQEFHVMHANKRRHFDIDPENPMWNVVIGSRGHEMRLSPITEIDVDSNQFTALVVKKNRPQEKTLSTQMVSFRIQVMPVDQGFVYPGETLMLTMKSVDLPPTSMQFQWYLERQGARAEELSLPSNMKVSPSGAVLTIWELRREQEGVVACSVYTNLGILATKRRFLIKEMSKHNNQLLFDPTRPSKANRSKRYLNPGKNLQWAYRTPKDNDVYNEYSFLEGPKNDEDHLKPYQLPQNNGLDNSDSTDLEDLKSEDRPNVESNRHSKSNRLKRDLNLDENIKWTYRTPKNNDVYNEDSIPEDRNREERHLKPRQLPQNKKVDNGFNKDSEDPSSKDHLNVDPNRQLRPFRIPKYSEVDTIGKMDSEDLSSKDHHNVDPERQSRPLRHPKYNGVDTNDNKDSTSEDPNSDASRSSRAFKLPQNGVHKSYNVDWKSEDQLDDNRQSRSDITQGEMNDNEYDYDNQDDKIERRGAQDQDDPDQQDYPRRSNREGDNDQQQNIARQPNHKQVAVDIVREEVHKNTQEDYSRMISACKGDLQCSSDAECIQQEPDRPGFCRCNPGYRGNGIFCWEENQAKTSAESQMTEDRVKTPELMLEPPNRDTESE